MKLEQLKDKDYVCIIDKSGSMARTCANGQSRWQQVKESAFALATKFAELDPDGIDIYAFSDNFKRHENVTPSKIDDVFAEHQPMGGTNLNGVLSHAFSHYFAQKAAGKAKTNGLFLTVFTDGEPDSPNEVARTIVEATKRQDRDEEVTVLFFQVGDDVGATAYLKRLDDDLTKEGAKFDIVDVTTAEEAGSMPLDQVIIKAITD